MECAQRTRHRLIEYLQLHRGLTMGSGSGTQKVDFSDWGGEDDFVTEFLFTYGHERNSRLFLTALSVPAKTRQKILTGLTALEDHELLDEDETMRLPSKRASKQSIASICRQLARSSR